MMFAKIIAMLSKRRISLVDLVMGLILTVAVFVFMSTRGDVPPINDFGSLIALLIGTLGATAIIAFFRIRIVSA